MEEKDLRKKVMFLVCVRVHVCSEDSLWEFFSLPCRA